MGRIGLKPNIFDDGLRVLNHYKEHGADIIFLDIHMPVMDGLEAAKAIREHDGGERRVFLVALTAAANTEIQQECAQVGMDDFMTKPFRMEELQAVVSRALRAKRAQVV